MTRETLLVKRDTITNAFNEQDRIKQEAEIEQYRLQGEYRLVDQLLGEIEAENAGIDSEEGEE